MIRARSVLSRPDLALAAAAMAVFAGGALFIFWNHWAPDLSAVYLAARFYGEGHFDQVYASPEIFFGADMPAPWIAAVKGFGFSAQEFFPYVYPPLWAAVAAPAAIALDPLSFFNTVLVVQVAALAFCPILAWRIVRPTALGLAGWIMISLLLMATSFIVFLALHHNQPQITVTFLILLAFERYRSRHPLTAGATLGLAAAMKISPILFVLIFVADRNWRALSAALLVAGGLAGLSFLVAGAELHWLFLEKFALLRSHIFLGNVNISLEAALYELVNGSTRAAGAVGTALHSVVTAPHWLTLLMPLLLAGGAALVLWLTSQVPTHERLVRRLAALHIVFTLTAPLSWAHYYLLLLVLLPALPALLGTRLGGVWLIIFGTLTSWLAIARLAPLSNTCHLPMLVDVALMLGTLLLFSVRFGGKAARD